MLNYLCEEFAERRKIRLGEGYLVTGMREQLEVCYCAVQDAESFTVQKHIDRRLMESECYMQREYNQSSNEPIMTCSIMILQACVRDYITLLLKRRTAFAAQVLSFFENFENAAYPPETKIKSLFDVSSAAELSDVLDCFYPA